MLGQLTEQTGAELLTLALERLTGRLKITAEYRNDPEGLPIRYTARGVAKVRWRDLTGSFGEFFEKTLSAAVDEITDFLNDCPRPIVTSVDVLLPGGHACQFAVQGVKDGIGLSLSCFYSLIKDEYQFQFTIRYGLKKPSGVEQSSDPARLAPVGAV